MILYTIGYEGLDPKRFLEHLSFHGVNVVADIRKLPVSRKKGFSKTALKEMLGKKNIEYFNFQGLGASKEIREELYRSGNYDRFFKEYLNNISDKRNLLDIIHQLIHNGKKVSLLCFERNPQQCHRKIVAEQLKKLDGNGLTIEHLVPY